MYANIIIKSFQFIINLFTFVFAVLVCSLPVFSTPYYQQPHTPLPMFNPSVVFFTFRWPYTHTETHTDLHLCSHSYIHTNI